tara:strand:+ start:3654 stop:3974 length:321 start_codon:yes stop_codon:yes gene_type:complete
MVDNSRDYEGVEFPLPHRRKLMSDLIPSINWTNFKKIVDSNKIGELKSCMVKKNKSLIFTAEIGHGDYISREALDIQAEALAVRSNVAGGKDPDEVLNADLRILVS